MCDTSWRTALFIVVVAVLLECELPNMLETGVNAMSFKNRRWWNCSIQKKHTSKTALFGETYIAVK